MEIKAIFDMLGVPVSTGIILVLLSFIKIPKIEVNVWQLLGKALSKGLTGTISEELKELKKDIGGLSQRLDVHISHAQEESALTSRQRILRFSDEVTMGILHSKEAFIEILSEIDKYENYCAEHPRFPNNRCVLACENIKHAYNKRLEKNDFLESKQNG